MPAGPASSDAARHHLARRLGRAVAGLEDPTTPIVVVDVDAGLRMGRPDVGPKRSPRHDSSQVVALAREVLDRGFTLVGVMTYEGQVAGVPNDVPNQRARSLVLRKLKAASVSQLGKRRREIDRDLRPLVELEVSNACGSGSVESTVADPVVTEVVAGSPMPWAAPDLHLLGLEGAGEVQTPLTGPGARMLRIGDWAWFRHAKSGELAEHTNVVHLLAGEAIVETVPSYRGLGLAW
jgi:D-serine deaminase-like pyridoxal phosphate-dependent protein